MSDSDSLSRPVIVTIDGGAATGKSSTSRALSERFNLLHVDTGAFYRTITLALLQAGVKSDDSAAIEQALPKLKISTRVTGRQAQMASEGKVPGDEVRSPAVNQHVSTFAANPRVRAFLNSYQRDQVEVARTHHFPGLVMEGRDIGSVIFPDADFRFFLQAEEEERLRRRAVQGEQDEIRRRDQLDSQRKNSPLVCPPGAITINSTRLSLEEVVEAISQTLEAKLTRSDS